MEKKTYLEKLKEESELTKEEGFIMDGNYLIALIGRARSYEKSKLYRKNLDKMLDDFQEYLKNKK